jgi:predicted enzyme related to lactoylglutathione lyase
MGERTSYAPGTFSWVGLGTVDLEGAKDFYRRMFAWEPEDTPAGEGGTYTMLRRDGRDVAGMYELSPDMLERGVPPHWLSYVTVADI